MKVSHKWLQEYFEEPLPSAKELGELLTFHAYELEGIEEVNGDSVIDVDILPNRSSDSMCHRGVAREIATILNREMKYDPLYGEEDLEVDESEEVSVEIEDTKLCDRYATAVIKGVKIGPSPEWLKSSLETLGQRSINNVVDATNYVMLNVGQPLHAFDYDKLEGEKKKIVVRSAKEGETITTLSEDEYTLTPETLLITDGVADTPIAIAGIKGGKKADVDGNTTNIVLESAHFNATSVRQTARRIRLSTDASQRFQNHPAPELAHIALADVVELILDITGGEVEGGASVGVEREPKKPVSVSLTQINGLLGTSLSEGEVVKIFEQLDFDFEVGGETFTVVPPFERTDINIYEDLVEEVGRIHGYEKLDGKLLPALEKKPEVHKGFYTADKVRNILTELGFSEIYGYTFRPKGHFEAIVAFASDKNFLRTNLSDGMKEYVEMNAKNAPLFGLDRVKLFEIGSVFPKEGEGIALCLGVSGKKADAILVEAKEVLEEALGASIKEQPKEGLLEINFEALAEKATEGGSYEVFVPNKTIYNDFSLYPFMLRDIALWVPSGTKEAVVTDVIKENAGELLLRVDKFDEFEKEGRVSYAYHLVFQSGERTLTDEEINTIMDRVTEALNQKEKFEVR